MRGYWNNDAANEMAFTSDGYFMTGDIGVFTAGGFLKIVDRKKDMVLVSGFNVYPNEIEAVVIEVHGVAECACIGVPDDRTGEALRLYVVKAPFADPSEDDIIAYCRKELAGYKVPRQVVFLNELPKPTLARSCAVNCTRWPVLEVMTMSIPTGYSVRTPKDFIGHDFGATPPVVVSQENIDAFADITGDHQWIHVDVERARAQSPFGGPVAHGFLTLSLLATAVQDAGIVPADAQGGGDQLWAG